MKRLSTFTAAASLIALATIPVSAQRMRSQGETTGTIIQNQPNNTGGGRDLIISRGATGADTITTNSAAGGNASRPEQAIPNSSSNGGPGGR